MHIFYVFIALCISFSNHIFSFMGMLLIYKAFWSINFTPSIIFTLSWWACVGQDSSVGIATCYGLDSPGIESRWGARFSAPVQTGHGAYPASYTMDTWSFPGVKRPWRGVDHPPPSSAEVKERVELYLYFLSGPSCPFLGWLYLYCYLDEPRVISFIFASLKGQLCYLS